MPPYKFSFTLDSNEIAEIIIPVAITSRELKTLRKKIDRYLLLLRNQSRAFETGEIAKNI